MNTSAPPPNAEIDHLHELFAAATHEASAAMSQWTNGLVRLVLDEVDELSLESVCSRLGVDDEPLDIVVLTLTGELGGTIVITFDEENGRVLAGSLLDQESVPGTDWTELEISALTETGNILACSFLNVLTQFLDRQLVPSPPQFLRDFGACVLEQAFATQAHHGDKVTVCRTRFLCEGKELSWDVFFVPSVAMRSAMEHASSSDRR